MFYGFNITYGLYRLYHSYEGYSTALWLQHCGPQISPQINEDDWGIEQRFLSNAAAASTASATAQNSKRVLRALPL